jgi:hypothetical protein
LRLIVIVLKKRPLRSLLDYGQQELRTNSLLRTGLRRFRLRRRNQLPELRQILRPPTQDFLRLLATSFRTVRRNEILQLLLACCCLYPLPFDDFGIDFGDESVIFIEEIAQTACHSCADVAPDLSEDDYHTACHVFATVVACAFDYGCGARVADGKAFACASVGVEVAACGSVEAGVADNYVAAGVEDRACVGFDRDFAAVDAFAYVVVAFTCEVEADSFVVECAEALSGGSLEVEGELSFKCAIAVFEGNCTGDAGIDLGASPLLRNAARTENRSVGIYDVI